MHEKVVNPQIVDSVNKVNCRVQGDAPSLAVSNHSIATSQALSNASHNGVTSQMNTNVMALTAVSQGVAQLLSLQSATVALSHRATVSS